mmetsp:Transcript_124929/g.266658  ORF Transcript_124929/g.266658 Transcript_124929/m.266658 type:complete len:206 (+) Transcript_124929:604-1221(+)
MLLRLGLGADEGQGLELCTDEALSLLQCGPKVLRVGTLGSIHGLQQSLQAPSPVIGGVSHLSEQAAQGWGSTRADVALLLEELLAGICQVNADRQHLGPGVATALGLLNHRRDLRDLLHRALLLILDNDPSLLRHFDQVHRAVGDAPDEILRVVRQHARRDDAEATRDQRRTCLFPVLQNGFLHGAARLESRFGVLPEAVLQHVG